jgi:hypothetical protein
LKQSRELSFLDISGSGEVYCLYEGQISILVTGIDEFRYDTICFADMFFDTKRLSLGYYDFLTKESMNARPDPIARGTFLINEHKSPLVYFLKVMEIWMNQVILKECQGIVGVLKQTMREQYVLAFLFLLTRNR